MYESQTDKELYRCLPSEFRKHNNVRIHSCPVLQGCICDPTTGTNEQNADKYAFEQLWGKFVDLTWCICLNERKDRLEESAAQFHQYGLCRLVHYFRSDRPHKTDTIQSIGRYGCWTSHQWISIITQNYFRYCGLSITHRTMRFEDDLLFLSSFTPQQLSTVLEQFMETIIMTNRPWHAFKMGQLTRRGIPANRDCTIFESRSLWTHAMILSESGNHLMVNHGYKDAAERFYDGQETDLDVWIRDYWMCYSCFPQFIVQSESMTSNTGNNMSMDSFLRTKFYPFVTTIHRKFSFALDVGAYFVMPLLFTIITCTCIIAFLWMAHRLVSGKIGYLNQNAFSYMLQRDETATASSSSAALSSTMLNQYEIRSPVQNAV